jgi:hypothetical protein
MINKIEHFAKYPILIEFVHFEYVKDPITYNNFYHIKVTEEELEDINRKYYSGKRVENNSDENEMKKIDKLKKILEKIEKTVKEN